MQVSQISDNINHAVIGGKGSADFGISDSPEFFAILSSALYKHPKLAMVRETICNAWDAHIASGKTDTPIEVSLKEGNLIIKDYGTGIDDVNIVPIYGIYGASTKKKDGRQTGGFGLGCKSPFAYTEHFEVISCHNGKRTIYRMSRSSAEANGKPSISTIATFPTKETGITVSIPMKPTLGEYDDLKRMILEVIYNGDILAKFNDELVTDTLQMDKAEHGFILHRGVETPNAGAIFRGYQRIFIRYGNVIYPLESFPAYSELYTRVNYLVGNWYGAKLVLQAKPDSISIAPSRENLSMSDLTITTVKELLENFTAVFYKNQQISGRHQEIVTEYIQKAADKPNSLFTDFKPYTTKIPGVSGAIENKAYRTAEELSHLEMTLIYSRSLQDKNLWIKNMGQYLFGLVENGVLDRGMVQSWIALANKIKHKITMTEHIRFNDEVSNSATKWWNSQVTLPLLKKMQAIPGFKHKKLFYTGGPMYAHHALYALTKNSDMAPATGITIGKFINTTAAFYKPIVFVCHTARELRGRLIEWRRQHFDGAFQEIPHLNHLPVIDRGLFIYEVTRSEETLKATFSALNSIPGIHVVDLTQRLPSEEREFQHRARLAAERAAKRRAERQERGITQVRAVAKKSKPGLVRLDQIIHENNREIDTQLLLLKSDFEKLTKPEFVIRVSTSASKRNHTDNYSDALLIAVAKLFGSRGAVTNKSDVYNRYIENGAMDLSTFLVSTIVKDVKTDPKILNAFVHTKDRIRGEAAKIKKYSALFDLLNPMFDWDELKSLLPTIKVDETTLLKTAVWTAMLDSHRISHLTEVVECKKLVDDSKISKEMEEFLTKQSDNHMLNLISGHGLNAVMAVSANDPVKLKQVISILKSVLK